MTWQLSPCLRKLNHNSCCIAIGKIGIKRDTDHTNLRFYQFVFCAGLIAVSAILLCISAIGLSLDGTDEYPWAHGSSAQFTQPEVQGRYDNYAGLSGFVTTWQAINTTDNTAILNEVVPISWTDEQCILQCCGDCHTASVVSVSLVFVAILASLPTLMCNCQRASADSDDNVEKMLGVFGGIVCFACTLTAFVVYYTMCASKLPETTMYAYKFGGLEIPVTVKYSYDLGIGELSLIIATVFQFVAVINQIVVQTPEEHWGEEPDDNTPLLDKKEQDLIKELAKARKESRRLQKEQEKNKAKGDDLKLARDTAVNEANEAATAAHRAVKHLEEHGTKIGERQKKLDAAKALEGSLLHHENLSAQP